MVLVPACKASATSNLTKSGIDSNSLPFRVTDLALDMSSINPKSLSASSKCKAVCTLGRLDNEGISWCAYMERVDSYVDAAMPHVYMHALANMNANVT